MTMYALTDWFALVRTTERRRIHLLDTINEPLCIGRTLDSIDRYIYPWVACASYLSASKVGERASCQTPANAQAASWYRTKAAPQIIRKKTRK